jgi:hypothetical protein
MNFILIWRQLTTGRLLIAGPSTWNNAHSWPLMTSHRDKIEVAGCLQFHPHKTFTIKQGQESSLCSQHLFTGNHHWLRYRSRVCSSREDSLKVPRFKESQYTMAVIFLVTLALPSVYSIAVTQNPVLIINILLCCIPHCWVQRRYLLGS